MDHMVTRIRFEPPLHSAERSTLISSDQRIAREPSLRERYARAALAQIPRLLTAVDRNPYRSTYGCFDRQFWHYRTAAFPSEMYQEAVLPLAQVFAYALPGNRWHNEPRLRELAVAGLHFAARSCHADGSCDDYYPFERALGAAAFSLAAATEAYEILQLNDPQIVAWFERRADWLIDHDETGRLANHQALAAVGLYRAAEITGQKPYRAAAEARIERVLKWQHAEGWFDEYGGADPGYQSATIEHLAKYRRLSGDATLDDPLRRAVEFASYFLHDDNSYGGEYGSRGTYHWYPHGCELLASHHAAAARLAEGFLSALKTDRHACFDDDRLVAHRLASLVDAYRDWSPTRPPDDAPSRPNASRYFPGCGLLVHRGQARQTIVSTARCGVWKSLAQQSSTRAVGDAGLLVEFTDGRVAVSQQHDVRRDIQVNVDPRSNQINEMIVRGNLHWVRCETATPWKQALFHVGMICVGRWLRGPVRWLLQRRLITGRRPCGMTLSRHFEWLAAEEALREPTLRITDSIELLDPRLQVRRMAWGVDHQTAYVAASNVYQDAVLAEWTDLTSWIERLNGDRRVCIVREW